MTPTLSARMKRRKVPKPAPPEPPESAPEPAEPAEPAPLAPTAPPAPTRGIIRKSAVRRWLKAEAQPVKIRDAFFAPLEAKVTADLARSLARAREQKRSTLMGSDA